MEIPEKFQIGNGRYNAKIQMTVEQPQHDGKQDTEGASVQHFK